jgi:hypothetical protein
MDRFLGRDVLLLSPDSDFAVELNKADFEDGIWEGTVPELYGNVSDVMVRVIAPDPDRLVVPEEDPSVTLLIKGPDYNPFQSRTLWLFARFAMIGFGVLGLVSLFLPRRNEPDEPVD